MQVIDPTIFSKFLWKNCTKCLSVIVFFVYDLLIWSQLKSGAAQVFGILACKYRLKKTSVIAPFLSCSLAGTVFSI